MINKTDNLVDILSLYTKLYHKHYSVETLLSGLPVELNSSEDIVLKDDSKSFFSRVASRAGFDVKMVKKDLKDLSSLFLPMIIFTKDKNSFILDSFNQNKTKAMIIGLEGADSFEKLIDISILEKDYLGYGFLLNKKLDFTNKGDNTLKIDYKHWLWDSIKLSKPIYIDVIIASILINLFILATPLFTMNVYDRVIPNNSIETLYVFTFGVITVFIIDLFLKYVRAYFLEVAGKKSDIIISSILFEKVMDIKISSFPPSVGSFANNLKDFDTIRSFLTNTTLTTLIDLPFTILFLIVIYYIGGAIVFIPIITIIILIIFALIIKKPLQHSIERVHEVSSKKSSIVVEALQNIETLKTLGMSGHMQYSWEEATGQMATRSFKSKLLSNLIPNMTGFFIQLNTVLIVFYGVYLIKDFDLTMGGLIAVVILTSRTVAPMGQAVALITNYEDAKTSYSILNDIMALPAERLNNQHFIDIENFQGKIEFRDVCFTYPNTQYEVLHNVSFTINKGEKVAIIGKIGSGKSTIEKLILKLYEPTSGTILIDGIDTNQIDPAILRKNIGYVSQEIGLFKGTIKENIIYKATNIDDETMLKASIISGANDFISTHPQGFDMPIGERGMGLSGGQKQAVAIARAFIVNTPVILLDEPTNAMDQYTESKLLNSLKESLEDKTTIIVTQKMSALDVVNRVIVLENGKIYLDGLKSKVISQLRGKTNG